MAKDIADRSVRMLKMSPAHTKPVIANTDSVILKSMTGARLKGATPINSSTTSLPIRSFVFDARKGRRIQASSRMRCAELSEQITITSPELAYTMGFVRRTQTQTRLPQKEIVLLHRRTHLLGYFSS